MRPPVVLLILAVAACGGRVQPVPGITMDSLPVPILDYEALAEQGNERVTVELARGAGELLYIGTHHTQNPDDPQIAEIITRWAMFRPSIALIEGRFGRYLGGRDGAITTFGEAGAVYVLAGDDDVPVFSLEAPIETEMAFVLNRWRANRVALFYVLRGAMSQGSPEGREREAASLIPKRTAWPGLEGSLTDLAHLDSLYAAELPHLENWRTAEASTLWPGRRESYLNEIATTVNRFRDEYMVNLLRHLLDRGERVFAVVGNSHVVMQAPALEALQTP